MRRREVLPVNCVDRRHPEVPVGVARRGKVPQPRTERARLAAARPASVRSTAAGETAAAAAGTVGRGKGNARDVAVGVAQEDVVSSERRRRKLRKRIAPDDQIVETGGGGPDSVLRLFLLVVVVIVVVVADLCLFLGVVFVDVEGLDVVADVDSREVEGL